MWFCNIVKHELKVDVCTITLKDLLLVKMYKRSSIRQKALSRLCATCLRPYWSFRGLSNVSNMIKQALWGFKGITIVTTYPTIGSKTHVFSCLASGGAFLTHFLKRKSFVNKTHQTNELQHYRLDLIWVKRCRKSDKNKAKVWWFLFFYDNGINCNQMRHCEWCNQNRKHGKSIAIYSWLYGSASVFYTQCMLISEFHSIM